MAFFSPGFMLGAAQRATEIIDDTRERNEDLAEEIKNLTKEHGKIAAKAISVRAAEDSEFTSIAKQTLLSSDEGKAILKNVENSPQTLVAIGREASKRIKGNLTPKLFNKSLLSKSTTPDGKFQNPYTLSNADLTKNPSEEAKQTEKLGFGQKVLQNLVGKKPTIEEATAGMTPEMREATLQSIRTGQPLATRDPVEFAAGQIETPVLSEAEIKRREDEEKRYQDRLAERRKYQEDLLEKDREYRRNLKEEERDRYDNKRFDQSKFKFQLNLESSIEQNELALKIAAKEITPQQAEDRKASLESLAGQLYGGNYYKNGNVIVEGESLFDAPIRILDQLGISKLSKADIQYAADNGVDKFISWVNNGRKEEGVGGSIDLSAGSPESSGAGTQDKKEAKVIDDSNKIDPQKERDFQSLQARLEAEKSATVEDEDEEFEEVEKTKRGKPLPERTPFRPGQEAIYGSTLSRSEKRKLARQRSNTKSEDKGVAKAYQQKKKDQSGKQGFTN